MQHIWHIYYGKWLHGSIMEFISFEVGLLRTILSILLLLRPECTNSAEVAQAPACLIGSNVDSPRLLSVESASVEIQMV